MVTHKPGFDDGEKRVRRILSTFYLSYQILKIWFYSLCSLQKEHISWRGNSSVSSHFNMNSSSSRKSEEGDDDKTRATLDTFCGVPDLERNSQASAASQAPGDAQAGVKTIEAVSVTWTKWDLIAAYLGYVWSELRSDSYDWQIGQYLSDGFYYISSVSSCSDGISFRNELFGRALVNFNCDCCPTSRKLLNPRTLQLVQC